MEHFINLDPITTLFYYAVGLLAFMAIGYVLGLIQSREWGDERLKKSRNFQRGVIKGDISEQLAPFLPGFPQDLKPSEAKFLGKPVDFIVFKGLDDNKVEEVVFVEVKSGRSGLTPNEYSLKEAIEGKRVRYITYHTPEVSEKV